MVDNRTVMENGRCIECGAKSVDGFSCYELFGFPLVWEHNDPELYALHFWLVSCYMIQHPSNYTEEGYRLTVQLFSEAYDNDWDTAYILKRNRKMVATIDKISNPQPHKERVRKLKSWSMTIENIYAGGEKNAIANIIKWKDSIRNELDYPIK
ncbi:DUF5946 family protein [Paenibacillus sp. SC116]|uniref:DUF5946 family protein n=1 Tax=Paenibacillus sp. SC116 TaxID=2968986 RepID=UPI00215B751F|nr:DUF5946 family protein [Paenibacillus sp. SC116]MCR8842349.1 DUF5946 family protein [Paenibacillus sp. SC116]